MDFKIKLIFVSILTLYFFNTGYTFSQTSADLNGSIFRGKAEEQTPPDVDRMPLVMDEVITFKDGKISGEVLKKYYVNECTYSAEIDDRRMVAVKVVNFISECQGIYGNQNVSLKFTGSVYGDLWMSGEMLIITSDNNEIKFNVTAEAE